MDEIVDGLNEVSGVWAGLMWAIVWQSVLLLAVVVLVAMALRRSSPVVRYWLWQIVAIKLLLMPLWTWAIPLPYWAGGRPVSIASVAQPPEQAPIEPGGPVMSQGALPAESEPDGDGETLVGIAPVVSADSRPPVMPRPIADKATWRWLGEVSWQSWLLVAWLSIVGLQVVRLVWQRIRLGRLLRKATPAEGDLAKLVDELAGQLKLRRRPAVLLVEEHCPLFVCGLWRPMLVFPGGLADSLSRDELHQAVLHELAHLKRRDLLLGWTAEIARMLYFFHPAVYWICSRLRLERELACDQVAMAASGGTAAQYAQTLLRVVDHGSTPAIFHATEAMANGLDGGLTPPPRKDSPEDE